MTKTDEDLKKKYLEQCYSVEEYSNMVPTGFQDSPKESPVKTVYMGVLYHDMGAWKGKR